MHDVVRDGAGRRGRSKVGGRATALLPRPWLHKLILRRLTDEKDNAKLAANLTTLFENQAVWNNKDRSYDLLAALQSGLAGRKSLPLPKPWTPLAETLASHPDGRVRMQSLELSYQFGDPAITPLLLKSVADTKKSPAERERALQLLARAKDAKLAEQLPTLLDDKELRTATIRALGMYDLQQTRSCCLASSRSSTTNSNSAPSKHSPEENLGESVAHGARGQETRAL